MSLFGLDCIRLSLLLTLHLDVTVRILHLFDIECLASCCLFSGLYGFRWACVFKVTPSFIVILLLAF